MKLSSVRLTRRAVLYGTTAAWVFLAEAVAATSVRLPDATVAAAGCVIAARVAAARELLRLEASPGSDATGLQPAQYFPWTNYVPQFSNFPNFPNMAQQFRNFAQQPYGGQQGYGGRQQAYPPGNPNQNFRNVAFGR